MVLRDMPYRVDVVWVPDNRSHPVSVEGEKGGPMIRRHGTCMHTCTRHKLSRYRERVHKINYPPPSFTIENGDT